MCERGHLHPSEVHDAEVIDRALQMIATRQNRIGFNSTQVLADMIMHTLHAAGWGPITPEALNIQGRAERS